MSLLCFSINEGANKCFLVEHQKGGQFSKERGEPTLDETMAQKESVHDKQSV